MFFYNLNIKFLSYFFPKDYMLLHFLLLISLAEKSKDNYFIFSLRLIYGFFFFFFYFSVSLMNFNFKVESDTHKRGEKNP